MEFLSIPRTSLNVSRVGIGTWAIGGWMWGGTDETESMRTIRAALDYGITVIDTASVYGFGRSEEIVGKTIAEGRLRSRVVLATKVGLEWRDGRVFRNASRARIMREIKDSLSRLRPTPSTFTRSTGPTRWFQSRRRRTPCLLFTSEKRFARSASAISPWPRWRDFGRSLRACPPAALQPFRTQR